VAYHKRHDYNVVRHLLIPGFGLLANLVCMAFYLISPVFAWAPSRKPLLPSASRRSGHLWSDLLHSLLEGQGKVDPARNQIAHSQPHSDRNPWVAPFSNLFTETGREPPGALRTVRR